jgi:hypothetical protein
MKDLPSDKPKEVNYWAFIGVLVAISPAIGYFIAFLYEQAYFGYFGIPSDFIIIDWAHVLSGMVSLITFSSVLFIIIMFPAILRTTGIKIKSIIGDRLIWIACLLVFVIMLSLQYYTNAPYIYILYVLPLLFCLQFFVLPLISKRNVSGYETKLLEQDKTDAKKYHDNNPEWIRRYAPLINYSIMLLFIVVFTAILQGRQDAVIQKEFLVFTGSPNTVVLNATQNQLICVELNPDKKTYDDVFTIKALSTDSGTTLQLNSIGPLKPIKP